MASDYLYVVDMVDSVLGIGRGSISTNVNGGDTHMGVFYGKTYDLLHYLNELGSPYSV